PFGFLPEGNTAGWEVPFTTAEDVFRPGHLLPRPDRELAGGLRQGFGIAIGTPSGQDCTPGPGCPGAGPGPQLFPDTSSVIKAVCEYFRKKFPGLSIRRPFDRRDGGGWVGPAAADPDPKP